jgi:hypothetical protein
MFIIFSILELFVAQNFSTVDAAEASALAAMSPASLPGVAADAGTASFADRWILHQVFE